MANLRVKATVTGPDEIEIPLVRADVQRFSNIFRTLFEICLAVFSSLIGVISSIETPTTIHFVFLVVMTLLGGIFLFFSIKPPSFLPNGQS